MTKLRKTKQVSNAYEILSKLRSKEYPLITFYSKHLKKFSILETLASLSDLEFFLPFIDDREDFKDIYSTITIIRSSLLSIWKTTREDHKELNASKIEALLSGPLDEPYTYAIHLDKLFMAGVQDKQDMSGYAACRSLKRVFLSLCEYNIISPNQICRY